MGNAIGGDKDLQWRRDVVVDAPHSAYRPSSPWSMHDGVATGKGDVTVFRLDLKSNGVHSACGANALKRSETLRHPDILTAAGVETAGVEILLVTRRVYPLAKYLESSSITVNEAKMGITSLVEALSFLHAAGKCHYAFSPEAVFVDEGGRFYVGMLDFVGENQSLTLGKRNIKLAAYAAPDEAADLSSSKGSHFGIDAWGLGILIHDLFGGGNGDYSNDAKIPPQLKRVYASLLSSDSNKRARITDLYSDTSFLKFTKNSAYVKSLKFLDHFTAKRSDLVKFLEILSGKLGSGNFYSRRVLRFDVLPKLQDMLEFELRGAVDDPLCASILAAACDASLDVLESIGATQPNRLMDVCVCPHRAVRLEALKKMSRIEPFVSGEAASKCYDKFATGFADADCTLRVREERGRRVAV